MRKVVLVGDRRKEGVAATAKELTGWLRQNNCSVTADLQDRLDLSRIKAHLIIVLGGDGSILSTARRLKNNKIPLAGVNLGRFGFLATYSPDTLRKTLGEIINRQAGQARMLLRCTVLRQAKKISEFIALNDAVISRGINPRMIYLRLSVNDKEVTILAGDGLIVSTPVGSTAHSLAAGGPIMHPSLKSFIITPICPHTLSMRPLVIPHQSTISVEVLPNIKSAVLTLDGQVIINLKPLDRIKISADKHLLYLVEPPGYNFYDTLRDKLAWGRREATHLPLD